MSDTNLRPGAGEESDISSGGVRGGASGVGSRTGTSAQSGAGRGSRVGAGASDTQSATAGGSAGLRHSGAPELSPQHPRGSGMSQGALQRPRRSSGQDQGYMEQASDMAEDMWRTGQDYYEDGARRVSRWASDHPNQMWAFIAAAGAFALWMAYRPLTSAMRDRSFDASRYRYRRLPRPTGRGFQRM